MAYYSNQQRLWPPRGLFSPNPVNVNPQGLENNIRTIAALQDPSGTLQDLQTEQILKGMAGLKTEDLTGWHKEKALQAIQDYVEFSKGLYQGRKGFNRLSLSPEAKLEQDQRYRSLLMDLNQMRMLEKDYMSTIEEVGKDMKAGILTPEEYNGFMTDLDKRTQEAEGIGNLPIARTVYNNFLRNKPEKYKFKGELEFSNSLFELYKKLNYTEGGGVTRDPARVLQNIESLMPTGSYMWLSIDDELARRGFYPSPTMTEPQKKQWLATQSASGFNPYESHRQQPINIFNAGGGKDKYNPAIEQLPDGSTFHDFHAIPVDAVVGNKAGKYVAVQVGPTGQAEVFVRQIVNSQGEPIETDKELDMFAQEAKGRRDPNMAGGIWVPYTKAVERALQMKNINVGEIKANYGQYTPPGGVANAVKGRKNEVPVVIQKGTKPVMLKTDITYTTEELKKIFPALKAYRNQDIKVVFTELGIQVKE